MFLRLSPVVRGHSPVTSSSTTSYTIQKLGSPRLASCDCGLSLQLTSCHPPFVLNHGRHSTTPNDDIGLRLYSHGIRSPGTMRIRGLRSSSHSVSPPSDFLSTSASKQSPQHICDFDQQATHNNTNTIALLSLELESDIHVNTLECVK